jgi:hypothetical protein
VGALDLLVIEIAGELLSGGEGLLRPDRQLVDIHCSSSLCPVVTSRKPECLIVRFDSEHVNEGGRAFVPESAEVKNRGIGGL